MEIQNLERFKRKLAKMPVVAREEIHAALQASAEEITDLMKRSAPTKSGALKRSIGYTFGEYKPANGNVRGVTGGGRGGHDLSVTIHAGDEQAYYAQASKELPILKQFQVPRLNTIGLVLP